MAAKGYKHAYTQMRVLEILSDGLEHTMEELQRGIYDGLLLSAPAIRNALTKLRRKLRLEGKDILCVTGRGTNRPAVWQLVKCEPIEVNAQTR